MRQLTERQQQAMTELKIEFDSTTSFEDAAEMIRDRRQELNKFAEMPRTRIADCMVVFSEMDEEQNKC